MTRTPKSPIAKVAVGQVAAAVVEAPTLYIEGFPVLRRIDVRFTQRQAAALRRIFDGLQYEGATVRLTGNQPVRQPGDAIRWMLDEAADSLGLDEFGQPAANVRKRERE